MKYKKEVLEDLLSEIEKIKILIKSFASLIKEVRERTPNFIELNALAMFLHSFYNGLEHIFKMIAKKLDKKLSSGERWHIALLEQMAKSTKNRKQVIISNDTFESLKEYLGFRHFSRNAYSFDINWDLMKDLIFRIEEVKNNTLEELKTFINNINE
ncbi:MAG: hypothetical protein GF383_00930 [Candidatus Lokiarchaeota archaeon]|nr:hypothetical protein [Candidatus Lokiarchaeota archaeon]MBD3337777.1 hypothetical protein [Candidatus Lokiarchaeota archaeon]